MKKLFVGSLPPSTTEDSLKAMFSEHGKVHSIKLVRDIFSGLCKGIGFVEMEGHEARAAITGLNGKTVDGKQIKVGFETVRNKRSKTRR